MTRLSKHFLFPALLALASTLTADVKMAGVFTNDMVLQREKPLSVWGWADPKEEVSVSFAGETVKTKADADGSWLVKLQPKAIEKNGKTMTVTGKNKIELKNILVGDVWFCGGQSNMEMPFSWPVMNRDAEIAESAKYPNIRHVKFMRMTSPIPVADSRNSAWKVCSPATVGKDVTVLGYLFARELNRETGIPIGIIDNNWSGSAIEPFIPGEGFIMTPELKKINQFQGVRLDSESGRKRYLRAVAEIKKWTDMAEKRIADGKEPLAVMPQLPSPFSNFATQYNAMIAPLVKFPIKGAIWYQGCGNGYDTDTEYYHKMHALVNGWRKVWNDNFPFYYVQLANFMWPSKDPEGGNAWTGVREGQRKALDLPKTGMVVTVDIGDLRNIHPENKQDVAKRLALWALTFDYGKKGLVYSGPLYQSMQVQDGKIRIAFDHIGSGLTAGVKNGLAPMKPTPNAKLAQFAIAGADKKWYWADAVIDGNSVVVSSPQVKNPVAVRYAFQRNPEKVNFFNKEGLPASPFRTDDWAVKFK